MLMLEVVVTAKRTSFLHTAKMASAFIAGSINHSVKQATAFASGTLNAWGQIIY
jgi:hypothetical protein